MARIGRSIGAALALALAAALPACSTLGLTGEKPAAVAAVAAKLPVVRVVDLDLGRTFDGYALRATGETETPGWREAELRPRPRGLSPDGTIEFDLVALGPAAPDPDAPPPGPGAPLAVRQVQAYAFLPLTEMATAAGIRVHALTGPATVSFTGARPAEGQRRGAGR